MRPSCSATARASMCKLGVKQCCVPLVISRFAALLTFCMSDDDTVRIVAHPIGQQAVPNGSIEVQGNRGCWLSLDDATGLFNQGWGSGCCLYMQASGFGPRAPGMLVYGPHRPAELCHILTGQQTEKQSVPGSGLPAPEVVYRVLRLLSAARLSERIDRVSSHGQ